ncbi:MAG: permease prefix domain 1-containing protein [Pirellulaceae bacterium]|nr:permease prefix domain 1-containing protein [Pirellulaceae bacterium]
MFDLDREVMRWCRKTYRWPQYRKREVVELEDHLHCAVAKWIADGLSPMDAFQRAVAELGDIESIRTEYRKNWSSVSVVMRRFAERPIQCAGFATACACLAWLLLSRDAESLQWTRSMLLALYTIPSKFFGAI